MTTSTPTNNQDTKVADNMVTRSNRDDKFAKKLGEDINEIIETCMEGTLECKLRSTENLTYFYNLFKGDTRRSYRGSVKPTCTAFKEASLKCRLSITVMHCRIV